MKKNLCCLFFVGVWAAFCGCAHHVCAETQEETPSGITQTGSSESGCEPVAAGVPAFSENRVVEIRVAPRCAEEPCRGDGECNTDCIYVTPVHAKLFYNPEYRIEYLNNPPRNASYRPGLARQVQWVVTCYSAQDGSPDASCEGDPSVDCVTRACPKEVLDAVVIRPTPAELAGEKSIAMKKRWKNGATYAQHRTAGRPTISKKEALFAGASGEKFVVESPFNSVFSGLPRDPDFQGDPEGPPRRLEWFYDVEVIRDGRVIIRIDPEIWLEEDG